MKHIARFFILLLSLGVSVQMLKAQTVDMSKVAFEILEYSIAVSKESLPQDLGTMTLDKISLSESSCDYYYTIKDNSEFIEYSNNKSLVKMNLCDYIERNKASAEITFLLCIDAGVPIFYHYRNANGEEFSIPFSVSEQKYIIGKQNINSSYRQEVMERWLQNTFSLADTDVTYQGMTDNCIMFTCMLANDLWDDDMTIDQSYMVKMVREAFDKKSAVAFFPLACLYTEKGEDLTIVNSKTGARKNGKISFFLLCNVYNADHSEKQLSFQNEVPPLSPKISEKDAYEQLNNWYNRTNLNLSQLLKFRKDYPNSAHLPEVNGLIVKAYCQAGDFAAAQRTVDDYWPDILTPETQSRQSKSFWKGIIRQYKKQYKTTQSNSNRHKSSGRRQEKSSVGHMWEFGMDWRCNGKSYWGVNTAFCIGTLEKRFNLDFRVNPSVTFSKNLDKQLYPKWFCPITMGTRLYLNPGHGEDWFCYVEPEVGYSINASGVFGGRFVFGYGIVGVNIGGLWTMSSMPYNETNSRFVYAGIGINVYLW